MLPVSILTMTSNASVKMVFLVMELLVRKTSVGKMTAMITLPVFKIQRNSTIIANVNWAFSGIKKSAFLEIVMKTTNVRRMRNVPL